jgi:hypothetical protein
MQVCIVHTNAAKEMVGLCFMGLIKRRMKREIGKMEILASSKDEANFERVILIQTEQGITWNDYCDSLLDDGFFYTTKLFSKRLDAYLLIFEKNNVTVYF